MAALHVPCAAERSQSPAGPWHQGSSCPRAVLQGCRHQVHGERCALLLPSALRRRSWCPNCFGLSASLPLNKGLAVPMNQTMGAGQMQWSEVCQRAPGFVLWINRLEFYHSNL